jgi:rhomboid-like protein
MFWVFGEDGGRLDCCAVVVAVLTISLRCRFFDHFAHLGGAVFGAIYYAYGPQFWNWLRVGVADPRPVEKKA